MTRDEKRQWKALEDDAPAAEFVALFWARRDPTPGTAANEFRAQFDERVAKADYLYAINKTRGALTDPGRVYIVIGPPERSGVAPRPPSAGRMSRELLFDYGKYPQKLGLTNTVVFIENMMTHEFNLDPQRANVTGALDQAVNKAIVNRDLHAVPDWARPAAP